MRKAIFGCLITLGFLAGKLVWADTYVSGTITENTTWTYTNSPYIATDTVTVANRVILTIEPGVTVRFATETSLICYGTLNAIGSSIATITFTSNQTPGTSGDWNGIKLSGSGTDGSQISYCDIGYAEQAVYLESVSGVTITHNYIHDNKGNDMPDYSGQPGSIGCGVYLSGANNNFIGSNTISSNRGGIGGSRAGWYASGGPGGIGCGIYLFSSTQNIITANILLNNKGNRGGAGGNWGLGGIGGVGCGIYLSSSNNNIISSNTTYNNTGGQGGPAGASSWDSGGRGGIGCGIYFSFSTQNTITQNSISNSQGGQEGIGGSEGPNGAPGQGYGIYIDPNSYNNTIDFFNTYNGEPIFYYHGITIPTIIENQTLTSTGSGSTNLGRIILISCQNFIIRNNFIAGGMGENGEIGGYIGGIGCGIYLGSSTNNTIIQNTISNNKGGRAATSGLNGSGGPGGIGCGIYLYFSINNTITQNIIFNNIGGQGGTAGYFGAGGRGGVGCGIYFSSSTQNIIVQNSISNNQGGQEGIGWAGPNGAPGQGYGIYIDPNSYNNTIESNNTYNGEPVFYYYGMSGITIEGQNLTLTGSGSTNLGRIVLINCSDFTIQNNTISGGIGQNGETVGGVGRIGCGIYLGSSTNITVIQNTIEKNQGGKGGSSCRFVTGGSGGIGCGIYLSGSTNNNIYNNTILSNTGGIGGTGGCVGSGGSGGIGCGIYLSGSTNNNIYNNTISSNTGGIGGTGGDHGSGGSGGIGCGIYLSGSTNNNIYNNTISSNTGGIGGTGGDQGSGGAPGNSYGIYLEPNSYNNIILTSNTYNGESIHYYYNQSGITIENQTLTLVGSGSTNLGRIVLINCSGFTITNNTITGGIGQNGGTGGAGRTGGSGGIGCGVYLSGSTNNNIYDNTILSNTGGIGGTGGNYGSGGSGGIGCGIYLSGSTNNNIYNNTISSNTGGTGGTGGYWASGGSGGIGCGIYLSESTNNNIYNNTISSNTGDIGGTGGCRASGGSGGIGCGVYLSGSTNNNIYDNTILSNTGGIGGTGGDYGSGGSGGIGCGIYLSGSTNNNIYNNTISSNTGDIGGTGGYRASGGSGGIGCGVYLSGSTNNNIYNNTISSNTGGTGGTGGGDYGSGGAGGMGCGIYLSSSIGNTINGNIISFNTGGQRGNPGPYGSVYGNYGQGYGIYSISNSFSETHYNNLFGNKNGDLTKGYGVYHDGSTGTISAIFNWWGASSGPEHPSTNPSGQGDKVSDWVDYRPYLLGTYTGPSILVIPTSGLIGTTITVEGTAFDLNKVISLSFGTHQTITTALSSENGAFCTTFIVSTQPSCTKVITATDTEGNFATTTFKIQGKIAFVLPSSGSVGDIITIAGIGFTGLNIVSIDFGTHYTITTTNTTEDGIFLTTFKVNTQPPCTKVITARDSKEIVITTFLLLPKNPKITLVSPQSGPMGAVVTIQGDGFGQDTDVSIAFGANPNIANTISSLWGSFSTTFIVDSQPFGTKVITATSNSCIGEVFATTIFRLIGVPGISLTKQGPATAITQSTITYTIMYKNIGTTILSDVSLVDSLPDGSTIIFNLGNLNPLDEGSKTIEYFATGLGSITNSATITGASTWPETIVFAYASCTTHLTGSGISLTKEGPAFALTQSTITYTLIYKNIGTTKLSDTFITDILSNGETLIIDIGSLNPGEEGSKTIDYYCSESASQTLVNCATIEGFSEDEIVSASASCTTHVIGIPGISLEKTGFDEVITQSTITYTLSYKNIGTTILYNVSLVDYLPDGSTITFNLGNLSPEEERAEIIEYYIGRPASETITNYATITGTSACPEGTITAFASWTTHILGIPGISLEKQGPETILTKSTITYTLSYKNMGTTILSDVFITDSLPNGSIVTFDIGTLAVGSYGSKTIEYYVNEPASTTITNYATITGTATCPEDFVSSLSSCTTLVMGVPKVYLKKIGPSFIQSQSTITYTLSYRNMGSSILYDVVLIDQLPNGTILTFNIGILNVGQKGTKTVYYYVTESAFQNITNSATITGTSICPQATVTAFASCSTHIRLSDLIVSKTKISPSSIVEEYTNVKITAWIKNIGNGYASNIDVVFFDENNQIQGTKTIGYLSPEQEISQYVYLKIEGLGTHTIKVIVDPANTIPEIDEDNNLATTTIFVKRTKGGVKGTVTENGTNAPIGTASVFASGPGSGMARTDKDGKYIINDLKEGTYTLLAYKRGYYPQTKRNIKVEAGTITTVDFSLTKRIKGLSLEDELSYSELVSLLKDALAGDDSGFNVEAAASLILALSDCEELPVIEEPATPTLTLKSDKETVLPPDEVCISIIALNTKNLSEMKIKLDFDKGNLKVLKIENGEIFERIKETDGIISLSGTALKDSGVLAKITFLVTGGEENIPIFISQITSTDINFRTVESVYEGITLKLGYPDESSLLQSFPNPAQGNCWIPFTLARDTQDLELAIYNILGQKVKTIPIGARKKGSYTKAREGSAILWDTKNDNQQKVSKGLYFYQLKGDNFSGLGKMVIGR